MTILTEELGSEPMPAGIKHEPSNLPTRRVRTVPDGEGEMTTRGIRQHSLLNQSGHATPCADGCTSLNLNGVRLDDQVVAFIRLLAIEQPVGERRIDGDVDGRFVRSVNARAG